MLADDLDQQADVEVPKQGARTAPAGQLRRVTLDSLPIYVKTSSLTECPESLMACSGYL